MEQHVDPTTTVASGVTNGVDVIDVSALGPGLGHSDRGIGQQLVVLGRPAAAGLGPALQPAQLFARLFVHLVAGAASLGAERGVAAA